MKLLHSNFKVKKSSNKTIVIEGLANASTVDRCKERINTDAWVLDNYKKNPVILFDHGHDPAFGFTPIGKAIEVEPTDDGLFIKAQISSSQTEKITAIRDLIGEGILKTFSVGFNPIDTDSEKSEGGDEIHVIKRAELIENSVVPIPMNQDSTFSVSSKKFNNPYAKAFVKSYAERAAAFRKGAYVAAALTQRLYDLHAEGKNTAGMLKTIAEKTGFSLVQVKGVLSGEINPVPLTLIKQFADALSVDIELLKNLNGGNAELLNNIYRIEEPMVKKKTKTAPPKSKSKVKTKADDAPPPKEDDAEDEDDQDDEKKSGKFAVATVMVSKEAATDVDAAAAMVEGAGYATDKPSETDENYVFAQVDESTVDMESGGSLDIAEGVSVWVAPVVAGDDSKAMDDNADENEGEGDVEDEADEVEEQDAVQMITDAVAMLDGEPDAEKIATVVETLNAALALLAENGKSFKPGGTKGTTDVDDNVYLQLANQTNVLLGSLIKETQGMSEKLNGMVELSAAVARIKGDDSEDDGKDDGEDDKDDEKELAKSLDRLNEYRKELNTRLKRLNV